MQNFLLVLDEFFKFKSKELQKVLKIVVHPSAGIDVSEDDLEDEHWDFKAPARDLPVSIFEANPVVGKRVVTLGWTHKPGKKYFVC